MYWWVSKLGWLSENNLFILVPVKCGVKTAFHFQIWQRCWEALVILGTLFPEQLWYLGSAQTKPGCVLWVMGHVYNGAALASQAQFVCLKILFGVFFPLCHFELFF